MINILLYLELSFILMYFFIGLFVFLESYLNPKKKITNLDVKKISIIIPFRNEKENLPRLLASLKSLRYEEKNFEIIMINDHSTDNGVDLVNQSGLKNLIVIDLKDAEGKKAALAAGISNATLEIIATTDADCTLPENWLLELSNYGHAAMILGPVKLESKNSPLHIFQEVEWAALQSLTAVSCNFQIPMLSNGANLAYQRINYREIALNTDMASGDDIFMLEDFKRRNLSIKANWSENNIVSTKPVNNLKELLSQKVRWASKSKYSSNIPLKVVSFIILVMNLILLLNMALFLSGTISIMWCVRAYILKIIADLLMITPYSILIRKPNLLFFSVFTGMLYPFYFVWIMILALKGDFSWKGRTYRA